MSTRLYDRWIKNMDLGRDLIHQAPVDEFHRALRGLGCASSLCDIGKAASIKHDLTIHPGYINVANSDGVSDDWKGGPKDLNYVNVPINTIFAMAKIYIYLYQQRVNGHYEGAR